MQKHKLNPSMNIWSKSVRKLEQNIVMIQMHLLSVQIEWMMVVRILMATTQAEKEKF